MNHTKSELRQMQSMPLEYKILATQERIKAWYEGWTRFNIRNLATGDERFETIDTRDYCAEPKIGDDEMIESAYPGQVYVSFSGGKDSTVLLDLARRIYPDIPAVFVDTGLEYPEIREFVKSIDNVTWLKPEMNFRKVIETYGYPIISKAVAHSVSVAKRNPNGAVYKNLFSPQKRGPYAMHKYEYLMSAPFNVSEKCCNIMKKKPAQSYSKATGKKPIIGTMACESRMRETQWMKHSCNAYDIEHPASQPLSFWTEQDVLEYISTYNLPYAKVYGEIKRNADGKWYTTGAERTGCMFCMFGVQCEKTPNRFQQMKVTHPKQYAYCMKPTADGGLGIAEVLDYIGVEH